MANNETLAELRQKIDGQDLFMGGHQILKVRESRQMPAPDWVYNNDVVWKFLISRYPKPYQVRSIEIWGAVIHYHLRMRMKASDVAAELNKVGWGLFTPGRISRIAYSIRKAYAGERTDSKPRTGNKVGRPRKKQE
jgi:hypothetical protein